MAQHQFISDDEEITRSYYTTRLHETGQDFDKVTEVTKICLAGENIDGLTAVKRGMVLMAYKQIVDTVRPTFP